MHELFDRISRQTTGLKTLFVDALASEGVLGAICFSLLNTTAAQLISSHDIRDVETHPLIMGLSFILTIFTG